MSNNTIKSRYDKPKLIINSPIRTGNGFLDHLLKTYVKENQIQASVYSYMHDPFLYRINDFENDKMFTILRNPLDTLTSSFLYNSHFNRSLNGVAKHHLDSVIEHTIDSYAIHYVEWLKNPKSIMILFEELTLNTEKTIRGIFSQIGYENIVMSKDPQTILDDLKQFQKNMPSERQNSPTDFDPEYAKFKEDVRSHIEKHELYPLTLDLYNEVYDKIDK